MVCRAQRARYLVTHVGVAVFGVAFGYAVHANALPFNDDMVHDQFKTSEVMRDRPEGSIPVGAGKYRVSETLATKNLTPEGIAARAEVQSPFPSTEKSVAAGRRLWAVNCSPCHGSYTGEADPNLPTSAKFLKSIDPAVAGATSGPTLVSKSYITDPAKSDGHLFSYIHFGGLAVMPRYGYKLSPEEHWNIIHYIRWMQEDFSAVLGMEEQDNGEGDSE
ncbi:cytochrome c [bacterium]|nr:cytochrome c [bacterium]